MTKEEIKQICQIYDNLRAERDAATIAYNSDDVFWEHVLATYKLTHPSLPSNLDKAAEKYAWRKEEPLSDGERLSFCFNPRIDAFKAGAEWMEKQGVYAYCIESSNPVSESPDIKHHCITLEYEENENTPYVRAGDRVKVILRKI